MRHSNLISMNALILHAGALGDCVLTLHVATALRKLGHRVTMAARSPIATWAAKRGLIDEAIPLDRLSPLLWSPNSTSDMRANDTLALLKNFDRTISFLGGPKEDVARRLTELLGSNRVIQIDPRPTEQTLRDGMHITRQWVGDINRQGIDLKYEISNVDYEFATTLLSSEHRKSLNYHITTIPNLLVHPGSGGRAKCCPLPLLEALMAELLSRGLDAQWMVGPDEVERDGIEFRKRLERTAPIIFDEAVEAAANRVAAADAFIGNDAGMTHVAALADVNTLALFGPTDPRVWRPLGPSCAVLPFPSETEAPSNWVASVMGNLTINP